MNLATRFSPLVRKGLRFRRVFDAAKASAPGIEWYPYDSYVNLFPAQDLMREANQDLASMAAGRPVLDIGAADGALTFYLESLGFDVDAIDYSGANMNRMRGIRAVAEKLGSKARIHDLDLDGRFELPREYSLVLLLGTLYHIKNPYYLVETLAKKARFCLLSTRVARLGADRTTRLGEMSAACLLRDRECNGDSTNYWIFTPAGLRVLVERAGWEILAETSSGGEDSDPVSSEHDERMFLLLRSRGLH